jgi:allophanate hydrolase subunit 1
MCGIYPNQSPGGWHIIGRSPLTLFDSVKAHVMPLKLGQKIKFQRILKKDFDEYTAD